MTIVYGKYANDIKLKKMKKVSLIILSITLALTVVGCGGNRTGKDPLNAQIVTLDNGLKIYMSVNKTSPRLQTMIVVRTGGKNDPSDNTGLAHYLEHIMFKGTSRLGTSDYEAEKPLLDSIEALYNVYRTKTDEKERLEIYHKIDSISSLASKFSIPNEYDKAMAFIGSEGSNAFTSNDITCYMENIPSNQTDNWANVQADRFKNMVVRGFHTELEAVYEEYNMGLTEDTEKVVNKLDSMLFTNHTYGKQTVIGTQEHLKNPSISAIKKQKEMYYVPNNIAICVSGDFDPKEFVSTIKKYFGDWKPNKNLPEFTFEPEPEITTPKVANVYGLEAESVWLAWRYPSQNTPEGEIGEIVSSILNNGMAGLLDLDINKRQLALDAFSEAYDRSDYGSLIIGGSPKEGQNLDSLATLLKTEVAKLRSGDFNESLVNAAVNNFKFKLMTSLEDNSERAMMFVNSFANGEDWKYTAGRLSRLEKLSKEDIVKWAGKYLGENSYAIVYKHRGENNSIKKISAPAITPLSTNRESESKYLSEIKNTKVKPIEPVFTDYTKDLKNDKSEKIEVLYNDNNINDLIRIHYMYPVGRLTNPRYSLAFDYLAYLGTKDKTNEEIVSEIYTLGCKYSFTVKDNKLYVSVYGLKDNIGRAMEIVDDWVNNAQADEDILRTLKSDFIKSREDDKLLQGKCYAALRNYMIYGPEFVRKTTLTNREVEEVTSAELLGLLSGLKNIRHIALLNAPDAGKIHSKLISGHHIVGEQMQDMQMIHPAKRIVSEPVVYVLPYNSRQFRYLQYSDRGEKFDIQDSPAISLFNEYFGGSMNSIVFQEMREARALAYTSYAYLASPEFVGDSYYFNAYIGSQNDKLKKAVEAFDLIINDMPESEKSFEIAKNSLETSIRTSRTYGEDVLFSYLNDKERGFDEPVFKYVFPKVQSLTMQDLKNIQLKMIKGRTYEYCILGDTKDLDMKYLGTIGKVVTLSNSDVFGY